MTVKRLHPAVAELVTATPEPKGFASLCESSRGTLATRQLREAEAAIKANRALSDSYMFRTFSYVPEAELLKLIQKYRGF